MPLTNDQKLLYLINATSELLKELTRCEDANSPHVLKQKTKTMRKELQLWIGLNRTVVTAKTPAARKKVTANKVFTTEKWLAQ